MWKEARNTRRSSLKDERASSTVSELRGCVEVEVAVLSSLFLIVLMVSVDVTELRSCVKVDWTSWAPVPNKPTVSVDVKQHFYNNNNPGSRP